MSEMQKHDEHEEGHEHEGADKGLELIEKPVAPAPAVASIPVHIAPPSPPTVKKPEEFAVLPVSLQNMGTKEGDAPKVTKGPKQEEEKMTITPTDVGTLEDVLGVEGVKALKEFDKAEKQKGSPKTTAVAEPPKNAPPVALGLGGGSVPPKKPTGGTPPSGGSPRGPNPNSLAGRFAKRLGELTGLKTFKAFATKLNAARPELSDLEDELKAVLVGATGAVRSSVGTIVDAFYADEATLRDSIRRVSEEHGLHLSIETFSAARGFYRTMLDQIHKINTPAHVYEVFRGSMTENVQFMDQGFPKFEERSRAVVMAEDADEAKVLVDELVEDVTTWVGTINQNKPKDLPASLRDIPVDVVKSELTIALRAAHEMALIVKNTTDPALALEGMMGRPLSEEQMATVRDQKSTDGLYKVVESMSYDDVKGKEQPVLTMRTGVLYTFSDGNERYVYGAGKSSLDGLTGDVKEGIVIDVRRWEDSLALKALGTLHKGVTVRARKASDPTEVVEMSGKADEKAFQSAVGVDYATFMKNPCKYLFDYQIVSAA